MERNHGEGGGKRSRALSVRATQQAKVRWKRSPEEKPSLLFIAKYKGILFPRWETKPIVSKQYNGFGIMWADLTTDRCAELDNSVGIRFF
jgi:hypothetical protein